VKQGTRGRKFIATAEQVLNHVLPALARMKADVSVTVKHSDLDEDAAEALDRLRSHGS
jgi:hypothetical protein